ncbi:MAG: SDR family oxidoreductase [Myxococcota bacterium]
MSEARGVMFITGASRGIGAATAAKAASEGWSVAVGYRSQHEAAEQVAERVRAAGAEAITVQVDVSQEADVVDAFAAVTSQLGPLRCLVNNAGILFEVARLDEMSLERVRTVVEVNVLGAFLCAREAVRAMSTRHGGAGGTIVNIGSAASYLGSANEFIDYAATKGALDTLTIGLAREVADEGIRVNCVRPGLIDTTIHADAGVPDRVERLKGNIPMQRGGAPEEVADLILYLAGDRSSYVTGSLINVSGGR